MNLEINSIEKEIFKEIVNIGLAKAADAFAVIAKEKVLISAPEIMFIDVKNVQQSIPNYQQYSIVIESDLQGALDGKTYLLFESEQVEKLVEICLGNLQVEKNDKENLQKSLLLEVGNIITGSLVTQLSNILQLKLFGSVPSIKESYLSELVKQIADADNGFKPLFFTVRTEFVSSYKSLEFPFLLIFQMEALSQMLSVIKSIKAKDGEYKVINSK